METWQAVAIGIIPSIGVGLIFWFAMRAVIRADRNERAALAKADAEEAAREAASTSGPAGAPEQPATSGDAGDDAAAGSGEQRQEA
ncbi:hypothetical protein QQX09_06330 [Demequina sp. SYSU T00192]|uniref:Lysyl-tRNA synthetase n=1 Tax=Demequina litoralis TaxID=3051660 RepID=A0ABT8G8J6_9MICO|nr:hypothetical protein [Demequina sp. SYSU T00192]MDN4475469.1 hypothetical protein [Demequina sp. SYSU T00192]